MTRRSVCQYPGRQEPIESLVVYWTERINGWWPGLARACAEPHCGGYLDADPPDGHDGRVYCIDCGREWATVGDKPPRELTEAELLALRTENVRRGRPRGRQSEAALRAQRQRQEARLAALAAELAAARRAAS